MCVGLHGPSRGDHLDLWWYRCGGQQDRLRTSASLGCYSKDGWEGECYQVCCSHLCFWERLAPWRDKGCQTFSRRMSSIRCASKAPALAPNHARVSSVHNVRGYHDQGEDRGCATCFDTAHLGSADSARWFYLNMRME